MFITVSVENHSSNRVCQKLNLEFVKEEKLPINHELRNDGIERVNIYKWNI